MAFKAGAGSDDGSSRHAQTVYQKMNNQAVMSAADSSSIYDVKVVGADGSIDQSSHASKSVHFKNKLATKKYSQQLSAKGKSGRNQ